MPTTAVEASSGNYGTCHLYSLADCYTATALDTIQKQFWGRFLKWSECGTSLLIL